MINLKNNMKENNGIIQTIVSSWGNLYRGLILLLAFFFGLYILLNGLLNKPNVFLNINGRTIKVGKEEQVKNYLVAPRGWTKTGIEVSTGDEVFINATGSVNVSMGHMIQRLDTFATIANRKVNRNVELFSDEEIAQSTIPFPWNGPHGIDFEKINEYEISNRIKTAKPKLLCSHGKVGQLIIYNYSGNSHPRLEQISGQDEVVTYKTNLNFKVKNDGKLFLSINDVVLKEVNKCVLNWQDNVGFFSVTISVKKKN